MEIKKATRKAIPFIGCLYGKSSGGKTYSALRLAKGLIDDTDRICLIDTENGRASHYADYFDFDVLELEPPFTPARYVQAISMAENSGYKAIIVDSITHEWDGIGGCLEMADRKSKSGKEIQGIVKWSLPKAEHRKLMNKLLQLKCHIIFCARGQEKVEQVYVNGKQEIVNKGLMMIQEKNFPFEMLVTFKLEEQGKAYLEKATGLKDLQEKFKNGEYITEEHGNIIAEWINKGDQVDLDVKKLKEEAREIALFEGEEALKKWFDNLNEEDKKTAAKFPHIYKKELIRIARERDNLDSDSKTANLPDNLEFKGGDDV
jgi:hypothetical protein